MKTKDNNDKGSSAAFKVGAIALAFLIIGYQSALFIHRAAVLHAEARKAAPDTVIIYRTATPADDFPDSRQAGPSSKNIHSTDSIVRKTATPTPNADRIIAQRRVPESFRFNPNTVSVGELQRLGFSEKQALAIDAYRAKGGRFRRREDFAKSFVVSDSVYRRLERYIDIPKVDINRADSAEFDTLPGIGGWFAAKMVEYRGQLGGYSYPEQLLDIYHFDTEKYDALKDLISCSPPRDSFALWTLPPEKLRAHPYIKDWQTAKAIVLYREHNPREKLTVEGLAEAGIIDPQTASKLARCAIPCALDGAQAQLPAR